MNNIQSPTMQRPRNEQGLLRRFAASLLAALLIAVMTLFACIGVAAAEDSPDRASMAASERNLSHRDLDHARANRAGIRDDRPDNGDGTGTGTGNTGKPKD